jgi:hypothetical protein
VICRSRINYLKKTALKGTDFSVLFFYNLTADAETTKLRRKTQANYLLEGY